MLKTCFKCHRKKSLDAFYPHPQMSDKHLGKCKACTRRDVKERYYSPERQQKIKAYEHARFKTEHRKRLIVAYQKKRRDNRPGKYRCRNWTSNAIRDGR